MGRRPRWQAFVEVPSLWFSLQLVELVIALGLLPVLVPGRWTQLERLASALSVYILLTIFNYALIQRSHRRLAPAADDVIVIPDSAGDRAGETDSAGDRAGEPEAADEGAGEHTRR